MPGSLSSTSIPCGSTWIRRWIDSRSGCLPELRSQPGYRGVYALRTDEGEGLLISLWDSHEAADAGLTSGFYDEQISKFVSFYKESPGRHHYLVAFDEVVSHPRLVAPP